MAAVFTGGPTYADTGSMVAQCKFLMGGPAEQSIGAVGFDYDIIESAGGIDVGTKTYGTLRPRRVVLQVCYVDATADLVNTAWVTDMTALGAPRSLSYFSSSGKFLMDSKASRMGTIRSTGLGTFFAYATVAGLYLIRDA